MAPWNPKTCGQSRGSLWAVEAEAPVGNRPNHEAIPWAHRTEMACFTLSNNSLQSGGMVALAWRHSGTQVVEGWRMVAVVGVL